LDIQILSILLLKMGVVLMNDAIFH